LKNLRTYLLVLSFAFAALSFQSDGKLLIIKKSHDYFAIDNLGNTFLIKESEMMKYSSTGTFFARYSNLKLGNITSVDATNGLRIMLFYKDYQQIVFLDNQLTQKSDPVNLENMGFEQTELVCLSANSGFWIFNKANNELIRFDDHFKQLASTGNLKQILQTELKPNYMIEHNGYLYLNCPESGIYIFDIFGAFSKIISLKNLKSFQVNADILYFLKDNKLCSYNYKLFEEKCDSFSYGNIKQAMYLKNKAFLSNKDSLIVISE
jgi:hypothetical protein